MKKINILIELVKSKNQNNYCAGCIFYINGFCCEPEEINCRIEKNTYYQWNIIKNERIFNE